MASLLILGTVPNLYEPSVLSDYSSEFITSSLATIDTNHQTIFKIILIISMSPFFKVTGAGTYSCFAEHETRREYGWRKPQDDASIARDIERQIRAMVGIPERVIPDLVAEGVRQLQAELTPIRAEYQDFLVRQKEIAKDSISTQLRDSWKKLSEAPLPISCDRLQFVRGAIQLQITTVDRETASHESVRSFETAYQIVRLEETAELSNPIEIFFSTFKQKFDKP